MLWDLRCYTWVPHGYGCGLRNRGWPPLPDSTPLYRKASSVSLPSTALLHERLSLILVQLIQPPTSLGVLEHCPALGTAVYPRFATSSSRAWHRGTELQQLPGQPQHPP